MRNQVLAIALALLATPGLSETYDCTTTNYGSDGWISDRIILGLDREAEVGSAFDYYINEVHKAPIPVTLKKRNETSYRFDWKLRNVKSNNSGSAILSHIVILNTSARTFTIRGRLHGYDNVIRGNGTCEVVK